VEPGRVPAERTACQGSSAVRAGPVEGRPAARFPLRDVNPIWTQNETNLSVSPGWPGPGTGHSETQLNKVPGPFAFLEV
jgi:hypothetical protein